MPASVAVTIILKHQQIHSWQDYPTKIHLSVVRDIYIFYFGTMHNVTFVEAVKYNIEQKICQVAQNI